MVHISKKIAVNYLNMIALNLTLMAALLRGEGEQKREGGGWGVETLGAQTKQIRRRYWREGALYTLPLPLCFQIVHIHPPHHTVDGQSDEMWRILMNICRLDGAFLLHWEVWLATLVSPPLNISPFCSVFAPRVTIINTPIHSHLISDRVELFSENLKPFLLMLHHSSVWYSRLIHEYLIFPSDSFVTNFDVSLNCHKIHISAFCSIQGNFPITGTRVSSSKVKTWNIFRNWHSIVTKALKYYWLFRKWATGH